MSSIQRILFQISDLYSVLVCAGSNFPEIGFREFFGKKLGHPASVQSLANGGGKFNFFLFCP